MSSAQLMLCSRWNTKQNIRALRSRTSIDLIHSEHIKQITMADQRFVREQSLPPLISILYGVVAQLNHLLLKRYQQTSNHCGSALFALSAAALLHLRQSYKHISSPSMDSDVDLLVTPYSDSSKSVSSALSMSSSCRPFAVIDKLPSGTIVLTGKGHPVQNTGPSH